MKKKILFVINTLGHAGAEVALLELLSELNSDRYEVSLFVLVGQGELTERLPAHVKLLNNSYCSDSVLSKKGQKNLRKTVLKSLFWRGNILRLLPYMVGNAFRMLRKGKLQTDKLLWRAISDGAQRFTEEFDLAVAYLEGGSTYYVADHVNARKKASFVHIDFQGAGYNARLDRDCYEKIDRIFAVSRDARESFVAVYPNCEGKTYLFHNIINQKKMLQLAEETGGFTDSYDGIRLLTVGRLNYQKGYDIAIKAMSLLKHQGVKARWYVLGDGSLEDELTKQIAKEHLEDDFHLLGANGNPFPYYRQCDIYVHATRFEGKSIAVQEAQTLGCAIIASDCNGNREQICHEKDGLLCPLTPEGISEAILHFIENPGLREACAHAAQSKKIRYEEEMPLLLELMDKESR